jgi:hypothetical protein
LTIVYRTTVLLLLIAGSLMSQAPINTVSAWDGSAMVRSFGVPNTASYGQVITVPAGAPPLMNFGLEIGNCSQPVTLRAEVLAWAGTQATGASLFESATQNVPASSSFQLVSFSTSGSGISLSAGTYVLMVTTSKDQSGLVAPFPQCQFGAVADSNYPGGTFVYLDNGTDTTLWTSTSWSTLGTWQAPTTDLAFQVNMIAPPPGPTTVTSVPAASTTSLLLGFAGVIGIGLLGLYRFRVAR